jgi:hypothetical protein
MTIRTLLLPLLLLPTAGAASEVKLPLPEAPVRVLIPDAAAFDSALAGAYRNALLGTPQEGDPLVAAGRQSRVGSKLEDQWSKLSGDLPWTWEEIRELRPRAVGFALLEVGHLEAVMVVETPLAALPASLPVGTTKSHRGVSYALVTPGAADDSEDPERRLGLAWAHLGERLILATSERALTLAIDEAQAGRGFEPTLAGLVSLELDLTALRQDRYFRREFLFPEGPETGKVRAALRLEAGQLVEVREGTGEPRGSVFTFDAPAAAAAGWEPEGEPFWSAFRAGLLEPIPRPAEKPLPAVAALPTSGRQAAEDRYAVNFTRPLLVPGAAPWEEGELALWKALFERQPVTNWGYWLTADGIRRLVFSWPEKRDAELVELCRTTVARRAGRATVVRAGDSQEIRVGPELGALAVKRTGGFLWVAPTARDLATVPTPQGTPDLVRWARVDLAAVRAEGARWAKAEGPARPEQVRPLSDRVLGLLGWMPATRSLSVESRKTAAGGTERIGVGTTGQ